MATPTPFRALFFSPSSSPSGGGGSAAHHRVPCTTIGGAEPQRERKWGVNDNVPGSKFIHLQIEQKKNSGKSGARRAAPRSMISHGEIPPPNSTLRRLKLCPPLPPSFLCACCGGPHPEGPGRRPPLRAQTPPLEDSALNALSVIHIELVFKLTSTPQPRLAPPAPAEPKPARTRPL